MMAMHVTYHRVSTVGGLGAAGADRGALKSGHLPLLRA
jgi:hypothetical protein